MGAFFAPLLVISGAKLYFLGAVLPFALNFRRWSETAPLGCDYGACFNRTRK